MFQLTKTISRSGAALLLAFALGFPFFAAGPVGPPNDGLNGEALSAASLLEAAFNTGGPIDDGLNGESHFSNT